MIRSSQPNKGGAGRCFAEVVWGQQRGYMGKTVMVMDGGVDSHLQRLYGRVQVLNMSIKMLGECRVPKVMTWENAKTHPVSKPGQQSIRWCTISRMSNLWDWECLLVVPSRNCSLVHLESWVEIGCLAAITNFFRKLKPIVRLNSLLGIRKGVRETETKMEGESGHFNPM